MYSSWFTDEGKLFQVGRLPSSGSNNGGYNTGGGDDLAGGWTQVQYHMSFVDDMISAISMVQVRAQAVPTIA